MSIEAIIHDSSIFFDFSLFDLDSDTRSFPFPYQHSHLILQGDTHNLQPVMLLQSPHPVITSPNIIPENKTLNIETHHNHTNSSGTVLMLLARQRLCQIVRRHIWRGNMFQPYDSVFQCITQINVLRLPMRNGIL
jgi:hypothetical protein